MARKIDYFHDEVSSFDSQGLNQVFMELISRMIEKEDQDKRKKEEKLKLEEKEKQEKKSGFCCA